MAQAITFRTFGADSDEMAPYFVEDRQLVDWGKQFCGFSRISVKAFPIGFSPPALKS
jgi:hypothetical protein